MTVEVEEQNRQQAEVAPDLTMEIYRPLQDSDHETEGIKLMNYSSSRHTHAFCYVFMNQYINFT